MPTFILGAGFNVDAARELGRHQHDAGYPLVTDTLSLCFGLTEIPKGKSIEDLFSESLERGEYLPLRKLAERLRSADHYVARQLASPESENCYQQFFRNFPDSNFLTFNYDSLPETFLFRLGRWCPRDGYGVPVTAHLTFDEGEFVDKKSSTLVLHLHGSLCIRTEEFEEGREQADDMTLLRQRPEPLYEFDPSINSPNFRPFGPRVGLDDVEDRIIAPVRDKSRGSREAFILATYRKAVALLRDSGTVVAIGYSFNAHDRGSYEELLSALCERKGSRLLVVSPDADTVVKAIRPGFTDLSIDPWKATFKQWVAASFPGLQPER